LISEHKTCDYRRMVSSCSESEGTHGEGDKKQSKSLPEAVNQRADLLSGFDLSRDFQTCLYYARGAGYRADKASHLFVSQVARGAQKKKHFSYRARNYVHRATG
jgi:hypothetical protein